MNELFDLTTANDCLLTWRFHLFRFLGRNFNYLVHVQCLEKAIIMWFGFHLRLAQSACDFL